MTNLTFVILVALVIKAITAAPNTHDLVAIKGAATTIIACSHSDTGHATICRFAFKGTIAIDFMIAASVEVDTFRQLLQSCHCCCATLAQIMQFRIHEGTTQSSMLGIQLTPGWQTLQVRMSYVI